MKDKGGGGRNRQGEPCRAHTCERRRGAGEGRIW